MIRYLAILLLFLMVLSLFYGLYQLIRHKGNSEKKGVLFGLRARILFGVSFMGILLALISTKTIELKAPWHQELKTNQATIK